VRAEKNVKPSVKIPITLSSSLDRAHMLLHELDTIAHLAGADPQALTLVATSKGAWQRPEGHIALVAGEVEIFLPLAELVDKEEERARLENDLANTRSQIDRLEELLGGAFAEKAPAHVVAKEREKLALYNSTADRLSAQLEKLN